MQTHLPDDGETALAVNHEYRHQHITRDHLIAEGRSWGLPNPEELVDGTLSIVLETATEESPHRDACPYLVRDITQFTALMNGRGAGES